MNKPLILVLSLAFVLGMIVIQGMTGLGTVSQVLGPTLAIGMTLTGLMLFMGAFLLDTFRPKVYYEWMMIIGLSCLLAFGVGISTRFWQNIERELETDWLVDRLEAYYQIHQSYPFTLEELSPWFVPVSLENNFGLKSYPYHYFSWGKSYRLEYDTHEGRKRFDLRTRYWYHVNPMD